MHFDERTNERTKSDGVGPARMAVLIRIGRRTPQNEQYPDNRKNPK
jgi:hypothetical protein